MKNNYLFNRALQQARKRILEIKYGRMCRDYKIGDGFKRIYLFHVRKTGGTSLNHMFLSLGGEDARDVYARLSEHLSTISGEKVFVGWDKWMIERGNYYYAFSHIPQHELSLPDQTFTVTCLRDPLRRLISHYKMLKEYAEANISHPCMATEGGWLGNSFKDFVDNMPREHLLNQIYMFSKGFYVEEAAAKILACSCWFFTEDFSAGVHKLSRLTGIELQPIHARKSEYSVEISQSDMVYAKQKLKPEYELIRCLERRYDRVFM